MKNKYDKKHILLVAENYVKKSLNLRKLADYLEYRLCIQSYLAGYKRAIKEIGV